MSEYKLVNKQKLLDDFERHVRDKHFNKLQYSVWRDFRNITSDVIEIEYVRELNLFHVYGMNREKDRWEKSTAEYVFSNCDSSLGAYLNLFWDSLPLEGENMTTTASTVTVNANDIWTSATATSAYPFTSNDYTTYTIATEDRCREISRQEIQKALANINKENEKMNTSDIFHFDFGPVSSNNYRMSPYGLAIRTEKNGWVAYNAKTGELMDVDILNFDVSRLIYKMPVAASAIKPGDILIHSGKPVFVRNVVSGDGTVTVIDYATASVMSILPVKSPFGFNFYSKVCPLIDMSDMKASDESPFGNMLPFLLMGDKTEDIDPMIFLMMGNTDFAKNPMMMYLLMSKKDKGDLFPFFLMMNGGLVGEKCPGLPTQTPTT